MLVLSRKPKQSIKIGDDVVLTVTQIKGDKVRIGIEAPREMKVIRTELEDMPRPEPVGVITPDETTSWNHDPEKSAAEMIAAANDKIISDVGLPAAMDATKGAAQ